MRKKTLVTIILSTAALVLVSGAVFLRIAHVSGKTGEDSALASVPGQTEVGKEDSDYTYIPPVPADNSTEEDASDVTPTVTEAPFVPATEIDLDPSSITVFVNKEYALPKDYVPEKLVTPNVIFNLITYDERTLMRPEAAKALEQLFAAAKQDRITLYGISAYRSYDRQTAIFKNNIVKKGKTYTLRYSAVPGTSEHQTGLSIDVSAESQDFKLDNTFASSPEGKWLAANAYKYGYIIRYPEGNEAITGYAYEPWHIRYVGKALADYLFTNHLTLEEYYHYTPSPEFDFEAKYASIINYKPPKRITPVPASGSAIVIGANGEIIDGSLDDEYPEEGPASDGKPTPTKSPKGNNTGKDTTSETKPTPTPKPTPTAKPTPTVTPTPTPEPTPAQLPETEPTPTTLPDPTGTETTFY